MSDICYLNGEFLPLSQARISPLDRGFLFGDGVYEGIPVYHGKPFRLAAHLARMRRGMAELRLSNPHTDEEWAALVNKLIAHHGGDLFVYLQVSRGEMAKRDHRFPAGVKPTVFMTAAPLPAPTPAMIESGVACVSMNDFRWEKCHIKSTSLLGNVLARQAAEDAGATECIMFRDGYLTEASASNAFIVRNGVAMCPPKTNYLLPGITDDFVVELARANGVPMEVRPIAEWEVRNADEIWISSSTKEVLPVTTFDGVAVGRGASAGKPGPVFRRVFDLYQDYKHKFVAGDIKEPLVA